MNDDAKVIARLQAETIRTARDIVLRHAAQYHSWGVVRPALERAALALERLAVMTEEGRDDG